MGSRRLDRQAAERVLRRAVELGDLPGDADDQLEIEVLLAAAGDLGVPATAVQRAVAEEQAGLLVGDDRRLDRVVGPASVSSARVVDLPLADAMALTDEWLRRAWTFRRVRATDTVAEYRRRTDAVAAMQRSARSLSGRENADKVKRLRVVARAIEAEVTVVALVVDLQTSRTMAEVTGSFVTGGGMLMSTVSALAWAPWAWLGIPASAAAGVGVLATRNAWTRGIDLELEGVLDRVADAQSPPSVIGGLTDRLRGGDRRT